LRVDDGEPDPPLAVTFESLDARGIERRRHRARVELCLDAQRAVKELDLLYPAEDFERSSAARLVRGCGERREEDREKSGGCETASHRRKRYRLLEDTAAIIATAHRHLCLRGALAEPNSVGSRRHPQPSFARKRLCDHALHERCRSATGCRAC